MFAVQCRFTSLMQLWRFCFFFGSSEVSHITMSNARTQLARPDALFEKQGFCTSFSVRFSSLGHSARGPRYWCRWLHRHCCSCHWRLCFHDHCSPSLASLSCSPPFLASWVLLASLPLLSSSLVTLELSRVCALDHLGLVAFNVFFSTIWNCGNSNVFSVGCTSELLTISPRSVPVRTRWSFPRSAPLISQRFSPQSVTVELLRLFHELHLWKLQQHAHQHIMNNDHFVIVLCRPCGPRSGAIVLSRISHLYMLLPLSLTGSCSAVVLLLLRKERPYQCLSTSTPVAFPLPLSLSLSLRQQ